MLITLMGYIKDGESVVLGTVHPSAQAELTESSTEVTMCQLIDELWEEWKTEHGPKSESDFEFVTWLIKERGFTEAREAPLVLFMT